VDDNSDMIEYHLQMSAHNEEGYGTSSSLFSVNLSNKGDLPSAPRLITFRIIYGAQSLSLQFQPPLNDGGSEITKYLVEWDNLSSLPAFSPHYGSEEMSNVYEVQEVILNC